ncbi:MAG: hypothetical protein ABI193_23650 [Minicystis sp.]
MNRSTPRPRTTRGLRVALRVALHVALAKGQKLGNENAMVKDGFLFNIAENKPFEIKGFKNMFVRAIEL